MEGERAFSPEFRVLLFGSFARLHLAGESTVSIHRNNPRRGRSPFPLFLLLFPLSLVLPFSSLHQATFPPLQLHPSHSLHTSHPLI